jgi:hypothetical protein
VEHRPYPAEPMRAGTVVARSVSTYIRNFGYFAVFTLLISGILALANFIISELYAATIDLDKLFELISAGRTRSLDSLFEELSRMRAATVVPGQIAILTFVASLFITPLVQGGIANITVGYFLGEKFTPGEWFRQTASKYKSLFIAHICNIVIVMGIIIGFSTVFTILAVLFVLIIIGINEFLGILLLVATAVLFVFAVMFLISVMTVALAVAVREDITGFKPFIRALRLCFSRFWRTIGITILVALVGFLCNIVIMLLMGLFSSGGIISRAITDLIVPLLITPLLHIALCLHYVSLRIEKEGYLQTPFYYTDTGYTSTFRDEIDARSDFYAQSGGGPETDADAEKKTQDENSENDTDDNLQ